MAWFLLYNVNLTQGVPEGVTLLKEKPNASVSWTPNLQRLYWH